MTSTTLAVNGMTCGGCENNVQFALRGLNGVSEVEASHEANSVTVKFDPVVIDETDLSQAIEAMGYTLARS